MYNDLVKKRTLQAYNYEAGYVISFVFFSLSLLSVCLRVVFVYPKTHLYSYFTCSPSCVGTLNYSLFPFLSARYKYVIFFFALKQLLTVSNYISRDKYASAHNQAITARLVQNARLTDVLAGISDDSFMRKCFFFQLKYISKLSAL